MIVVKFYSSKALARKKTKLDLDPTLSVFWRILDVDVDSRSSFVNIKQMYKKDLHIGLRLNISTIETFPQVDLDQDM